MSYNSERFYSGSGFFFKPYGSNELKNSVYDNLKDISWDFYLQACDVLSCPFINAFNTICFVEENWPLPLIPIVIPIALGLLVLALSLAVLMLALVTRALATLVSPVVSLDESEGTFNYFKGFN